MLSSSLKDFKILALALSALIAGVQSQTTCTAASPDCCWVLQAWKDMGQSLSKKSSSSTTDCCSMKGVTCDSTKTKVTNIDWNAKKLKGALPSSLQYLLNLKTLDLGGNKLSGSLPEWIGKLTNLETLFVQDNSLSGAIPSSIGNLTKLNYLRLSLNKFSGSLPSSIGNLINLKEFWLGSNQVSGSIPSSILNLVNLNTLLRFNQFEGDVPRNLGTLLNLKNLYFTNNPKLGGYLSIKCGLDLEYLYTKITVCGCPSNTPASKFPIPAPPIECLGTPSSNSTTISKRGFTFSSQVNNFKFDCNWDTDGNPYQNCIYLVTFFCNPDRKPEDGPFDKDKCRNAIDAVFQNLNINWRSYRAGCGNSIWPFSNTQTVTPLSCPDSVSNLKTRAFYWKFNEFLALKKVEIDPGLIDSGDYYLWKNPRIR